MVKHGVGYWFSEQADLYCKKMRSYRWFSQTELLAERSSALSPRSYWGWFAFQPAQTNNTLSQTAQLNFKNSLKTPGTGCSAWWSTASQPQHPHAVIWAPRLQSQTGGAGRGFQSGSVPSAATEITDNSRAVPDPRAREITAKSPWSKCIRLLDSLTL